MSVVATVPTTANGYEEHNTGDIVLSGYHFHHNRCPFYILFGKKDKYIYIEKVDPHTCRNKYVSDIVMPFEEMEKNECLKKYYDMSVMMVDTNNAVYYNKAGVDARDIVSNYDTESEDEEGDEVVIRHWCISCDCNWKNLRVSKHPYNLYFNMNPLTYEYNVSTEKKISSFMKSFDAFAKYNNVCPAIEKEIVANYNYHLRLIRN